MSRPSRPSDFSDTAGQPRTFFTTTRAYSGQSLFQTARMANLMIDVLRSLVMEKKFVVHDFVVMPNHLHLLATAPADLSLEKMMQFVKGRFSFRVAQELGYEGEVWQPGFSDVRVRDEQSFRAHQKYIWENPVRAGLASTPEEYPYGSAYLKKQKRAGAKAPAKESAKRHG